MLCELATTLSNDKMFAFTVRLVAKFFLAKQWHALHPEIRRQEQLVLESPPSNSLVKLLVSGEDRRHGTHAGFDIRAIIRATIHNILQHRHEGASTIEQQLVRVLTNRFERTFRRKLREILLASLVAEYIDKRHLPAIYLQVGYFGTEMVGLDATCSRLGLNSKLLTLWQAALVVARLKYPEPRAISQRRSKQISTRALHLIHLYQHHSQDRTYEFLKLSCIQDATYNCHVDHSTQSGVDFTSTEGKR
jgi:membrane peptidoglycan carboxypeptidase